jgi:hypothetical protein
MGAIDLERKGDKQSKGRGDERKERRYCRLEEK